MPRKGVVLKTISIVVATAFFWTNCVYATGAGVQNNYLAVDAGKLLEDVFLRFRMLSTPLAIHNAVTASGITDLRNLAARLDVIKDSLISSHAIKQDEADRYPCAVMFEDPSSSTSAYYYFTIEGDFMRVTDKEGVRDSLYTAFLQPKAERIGEVVHIGSNYIERFRISRDNMAGINRCLKKQYGYTLDEITEKRRTLGSPAECLRLLWNRYKKVDEVTGKIAGVYVTIGTLCSIERDGRIYKRSTIRGELRTLADLGLVVVDRTEAHTSKYRLSKLALGLSSVVFDRICGIQDLTFFRIPSERLDDVRAELFQIILQRLDELKTLIQSIDYSNASQVEQAKKYYREAQQLIETLINSKNINLREAIEKQWDRFMDISRELGKRGLTDIAQRSFMYSAREDVYNPIAKYKGAVFDMDGVIVDTEDMHFSAYKRLFETEGYTDNFTHENHLTYTAPGTAIQACCNYLYSINRISSDDYSKLNSGEQEEIRRLVELKAKYVNELIDSGDIKVFSSTISLIRDLKGLGFKIAVASSSRTTRRVLERIGILNIIDAVITGSDVSHSKPHPEPYSKAVESIGLKPEECVAFEDTDGGIESAKGAGLFCVGLDRISKPDLLREADIIVNDVSELDREAISLNDSPKWKQIGAYEVGESKGRDERPGALKAMGGADYVNRAYNPDDDVMKDSLDIQPNKVMFTHKTNVFGREKPVLIWTNTFPVVEKHFMIVNPENKRQGLDVDFIRACLDVISQLNEYTFSYNSIGAKATVNHPHVHGYPSFPSSLDSVRTTIVDEISGIRLSRLDPQENTEHPAGGFVIEYSEANQLDMVSLLVSTFVQDLTVRDIKHTLVFRNNRIFIFPRKALPLGEFGQSYAGFEYVGRILLTAQELINTPYAKERGIDLAKLNQIKQDPDRYNNFITEAFKSIDSELIKSGFRRLNVDNDLLGQIEIDFKTAMGIINKTEDPLSLDTSIHPYVWLCLYKIGADRSDKILMNLINLLLERYMMMMWLNGDEVKTYPQEVMDKLVSGLELGISDEELINKSTVSGPVKALLHARIVAPFSKTDLEREKNIENIRRILFGTRDEYKGYDVIIIGSTTDDEREIVEEQFEALFKDKGVTVLSVKLDVCEGGPTMDSMRAYLKAKELAGKKGLDLDAMWREEKKICVIPNAGKGSRCSPIPQAESNSRGGIRLGGEVSAGGSDIPISLIMQVYAQNAIFAETNNGELDVFYASQVYVPTRDFTGTRSPNTFLTKFVSDVGGEEEFTPDAIRDLGSFELDDQGNIVVNNPKGTFRNLDEARAEFRKTKAGGMRFVFSCGSHRIKRPFFDALIEFYGDLNDPSLSFEPPDFIMPLLLVFSGLKENNIDLQNNSLTEVVDVIKSIPANRQNKLGKWNDEQFIFKNKKHENAIKFYLKNKNNPKLGNPKGWIGAFEIGSDMYWWRYRRPLEVLNSQLLMLSDLAGKKVQINEKGEMATPAIATYKDKKGAKALRRLRGINHPITNCVLGNDYVDENGRRRSDGREITEEDIREGITIGGIYIKGSILFDSTLASGSHVLNSFIERSAGLVKISNGLVENSRVRELDAKDALVYNVVEKDKLEVKGTSCVDVFRPDIRDSRFFQGQTRMLVKFDVDANKKDGEVLESNRYSFKDLREMQNVPSANRTLRNTIVSKIPPITIWRSGDGKSEVAVYSNQKGDRFRLQSYELERDTMVRGPHIDGTFNEISKLVYDSSLHFTGIKELWLRKMQMIADISKRLMRFDERTGDITEGFRTLKEGDFRGLVRRAKEMRQFEGIKHPISNCKIGDVKIDKDGRRSDTKQVIDYNMVMDGLNISGVYIKGSVIQNSIIQSGSHVEGSVITDTEGKVFAACAYVHDSEVSDLAAEYALVYSVVERNNRLEVKHTSVTDVFGTQIHDENFPDGQTRMWVNFNTDASFVPGRRLVGLEDLFKGTNRFKGAVFDLDGVIATTSGQHYKAWKRMFEKDAGIREFTERDYEQNISGLSRYDGCLKILAMAGIQRFADLSTATKGRYVYPGGTEYEGLSPALRAVNDEVKRLADLKDVYYQEFLEKEDINILPGALELILDLRRRGIKLAVVSSSRNAEQILKKLNLFEIFGDNVVSGIDIQRYGYRGKPDPELFIIAARRLGVNPEDCAGFEDAADGVKAIKAAKMLCVGITGESREQLREADVIVHDLREVQYKGVNRFGFDEIRSLKSTESTGFKGAVFDMDGVIATTGRLHYRAWGWMFETEAKVGEQIGNPKWKFSKGDYEKHVSGIARYDGCLAMLTAVRIPRFVDLANVTGGRYVYPGTPEYGKLTDEQRKADDEVKWLGDKKNDKYNELLITMPEEIEVLRGAVTLLRDLKRRGIKLAIASSSKNTPAILKIVGLDNMFDAVVSGIDIEKYRFRGKPAPDIFKEAARRIGLNPSECIGFEDAIKGIAAIKEADMTCVGVSGESKEALEASEVVVDFLDKIDFGDLNSLVVADLVRKKLGIDSDAVDYIVNEKREPRTSWEALFYYFKTGKIRFSINDLPQSATYGVRTDPLVDNVPVSLIRTYVHKGEREKIISEDEYKKLKREEAEKYVFYYYAVNIPKKEWQKQKNRKEFLARVIIHAWIEHFMPYYYSAVPSESPAHLSYFADKETLGSIGRALDTDDVIYLYQLLVNYRISKDPAGVIKNAVFNALKRIEDKKEAQFLIDSIREDTQLLAWYRYQLECKKLSVEKISEFLGQSGSNEVIRRNLLDSQGKYLFRYVYTDKETGQERTVYLPQNVNYLLGVDQFDSTNFVLDGGQDTSYRGLASERTDLIQKRDGLRKERDELRKKPESDAKTRRLSEIKRSIQSMNNLIYTTLRGMFRLYDAPIIDRITQKIRQKTEQTPGECIVVGVYGPAGTGKSELSEFLIDRLKEERIDQVNYLSLDSYLHYGEGFRYRTRKDGSRITFLSGQGMYDLDSFYRDLADIKAGKKITTPLDRHAPGYEEAYRKGLTHREIGPGIKVLVVDIACLALDRRIAERIDVLFPIIFKDDINRFEKRVERDVRPEDERDERDGSTRALSLEYLLRQFALFQFTETHDNMTDMFTQYAGIVWQQDTNTFMQKPEMASGPVGKNVTGGQAVENLLQASIKDDGTLDNVQTLNATHPKFTKIDLGVLQNALNRIKEKHKLGIFGAVDAIRIVDNLNAEMIRQGEKGIVPYAMMAEEDGKNVLLLDVDAFLDIQLLYLVLDHELMESIMTIVPCSNKAIRELTTNYLSLKLALEEGIKVDKARLKELGADLQFFEALEVLQAMAEAGGNITDNKIIAVAIEHMKGMPYYTELFEQFPFAGEWRKAMGDITEAKARYEAALRVFDAIMEPEIKPEDTGKEEKESAQRGLRKAVSEVNVNIKVIKTFTGEKRIVGLEGLPGLIKKGIGAVAKSIWGRDLLKDGLEKHVLKPETKITETHWIVISSERKKQLEDEIGKDVMDEQIKALESIQKDGVQVFRVVDSVSEVPETAFDKVNPRVICLFDFADWDKVSDEISKAGRDRESAMYFPTLYMSSSLYIAAQILVTGGNVNAISDTLASSIIKNLYSAVLGREATDTDLVRLFRSPWEILPSIVRLTTNIDALRTAIVQIEKAA